MVHTGTTVRGFLLEDIIAMIETLKGSRLLLSDTLYCKRTCLCALGIEIPQKCTTRNVQQYEQVFTAQTQYVSQLKYVWIKCGKTITKIEFAYPFHFIHYPFYLYLTPHGAMRRRTCASHNNKYIYSHNKYINQNPNFIEFRPGITVFRRF